MFKFFQRQRPADLIADQIHEARIAALEHRAAAEHHRALADMYEQRVDRLDRMDEHETN